MAISKERKDRFTAKESDFEIVKPAPKKKAVAPAAKKPEAKKPGTGAGKRCK